MPSWPLALLALCTRVAAAPFPDPSPEPCESEMNKIKDLLQVSCVDQGLASVPGGLPKETGILRLSGNRLAQVSLASFQPLSLLSELDLTNNSLSALETGTTLPSLQQLLLSHNALERLPAFQGLPALWRLALDHNALAGLPEGGFRGLGLLLDLELQGNRLHTLPPSAFAGLGKLRDLDLADNRLEALPVALLAELPDLQILRLERNRLEGLPTGFFPEETTFAYLYLAENPWRCDCNLRYLSSWLAENEHTIYTRLPGPGKTITEINPESVQCHQPPEFRGHIVLNFTAQGCEEAEEPTSPDHGGPTTTLTGHTAAPTSLTLTSAPTIVPLTPAPTSPPVTSTPTSSPLTSTPTIPLTSAPTSPPMTSAHTTMPLTSAPSSSPLTLAPTIPLTSVPTTTPLTSAPTTTLLTSAPTMIHLTSAHTTMPLTSALTSSPLTPAPTTIPLTSAPTTTLLTSAPTTIHLTSAHTTMPLTSAPTSSPLTPAPTTIPLTSAPTSPPAREPPCLCPAHPRGSARRLGRVGARGLRGWLVRRCCPLRLALYAACLALALLPLPCLAALGCLGPAEPPPPPPLEEGARPWSGGAARAAAPRYRVCRTFRLGPPRQVSWLLVSLPGPAKAGGRGARGARRPSWHSLDRGRDAIGRVPGRRDGTDSL